VTCTFERDDRVACRMKKMIGLLVLTAMLAGCAHSGHMNTPNNDSAFKQSKPKDVREEIWLQLSKESRVEIAGSWQRGKVRKVTIESANQFQGAEKYIGNELLMASFPTKDPSLEEVVVFVDPQTHKIVRTGLSD
jgi:hypothetical protein